MLSILSSVGIRISSPHHCFVVILSWISTLLKKSRKQGVLHPHDLYELPPYLQSSELTDKLENNWFDEVNKHPTNPSLLRATIRTLGWKQFFAGFFAFANVSTEFT